MKFIFFSIPSRGMANPYQELFYNELEKHGIEVRDQTDFRITDIIRNRNRINILHFHWSPAPESNLLWGYINTFLFSIKLFCTRLMGIKIVWTAHNLLPHDIKYYRLQFIRRWILVHMCNVIIVHFEKGKDILHTMFHVSKQKMICIHHGLYEGYYPNFIKMQSARDFLKIPKDATVFLYFGNIRQYKNIENLIKGFQAASTGNPNIILYLVGNLENKIYMQELIVLMKSHPQIRSFFGFIPNEEIQNYFNASDCCIFPYTNIFTSGAALLALTFRKPVIMKKCEFSDEYFISENGIFLHDTNSQGIKNALEDFYQKKEFFKITEEFVSQYKWQNIIIKDSVDELQNLLSKA